MHWSVDRVQRVFGGGRGGERCALVEGKGKGLVVANNLIKRYKIMEVVWGREDEDKRRREDGQTCDLIFFLSSKMSFLGIYEEKKNQHIPSLSGAWSFLLVHIQFTPTVVRGPKAL